MAINGLPSAAMQGFADWLEDVMPAGGHPQFLAFNAPFDWMFVCDYFHYLGRNPFGHTAIDIKAYAMGRPVSLGRNILAKHLQALPGEPPAAHHALQDAIDQAEIFQKIFPKSET
jgi:hypothetical protein